MAAATAAAGGAYHSPQFSEDVAWLPPWLQPHRLPDFGGGDRDELDASVPNGAPSQENCSSGQVGRLFAKGDAKYAGCHLYFSEDSSFPAGNTPSGQALQFRLQFSSSSASQISPGQFGDLPQTGRCETNETSLKKAQGVPRVHYETSSQLKMDNDVAEAESPAGCKSGVSPILNSQPFIQGDWVNHENSHQKCDASKEVSAIKYFRVPETKKFENEGSPGKTIPKTSTTQNDPKMGNGVPALDTLEVGCKAMISDVAVEETLVKDDQNKQQKFHSKLDAGNLKTADIDHAIELSIAASEAMVISEMVSSSFTSDILPAAAILEIALRVRQARKHSYADTLEANPVFSPDGLDETDQLSDLDDDNMEDVFQDVGLSVAQIVETPEHSFEDKRFSQRQQIMQSNSLVDLDTHVSESHSGRGGETQTEVLKTQDNNINTTISQTIDLANESQSKELPSRLFSPHQAKSTALVSMDPTTSCLRNQLMAHTEKLIHNADALTATQKDHRDYLATLKDSRLTPDRTTNIKKSIKELDRGETSFISESMDVDDQYPSEEPEFDIVASSNTPIKDLSKGSCKEKETNISDTVMPSQDIVRSSILSSVDPMCSIVPCSITLHDDPLKEVVEKGGKINISTASAGFCNLNRKTSVPVAKDTLPTKSLDHDVECVLPNISLEGSGVPYRRQFNSLKHYSMVIPCWKEAGNACQSEPISLYSMGANLNDMFSTEHTNDHFACKKKESRLPLELTDKYLDVGPNNGNDIRSKDHEMAGHSSIGERKVNKIGRSIETNESHPPLILNYKKRRLQAIKIVSNHDDEDGNFKKPSSPNKKKYRQEIPTNEVSCRDQTTTPSCYHQESNLHLKSANKYLPSDKKVRFVEPESSIERSTPTGGRPQSAYKTRSHSRRRKRVESCLHFAPESGKEAHNSSISCPMMHGKGTLFQGLDFLLTGFSSKKTKEIEELIRKHGGCVLSNIPSVFPAAMRKRMDTACLKFPIVLSAKKTQTTKFLYGCATSGWILNVDWLVDSVQAGSLLPPAKYMFRPMQAPGTKCFTNIEPPCFSNCTFIFDRVGIMLYGKTSFCTKFSQIIKHGGGQVFKTLQRLVHSLKNGKNLVGVVVVENEYIISRHLKHCALEQSLQTMSSSWIVNSLYSGKLLPFKKDCCAPLRRIRMPTFPKAQVMEMSQEI